MPALQETSARPASALSPPHNWAKECQALIRRAMTRLLLLLIALLAATPAAAATVTDLRLVGDATRTRLIVDVDGEPRYGLLRLADPFRLVVDLADAAFAGEPRPGEGRGLVSDYRYGLIAPGKARIVLDLAAPADVSRHFILPAAGTQPARLVVDLVPASREAFLAAARDDALGAAAPPPSPLAARPAGLPVVVVDPGHGGIDVGAEGAAGLREKEVTLAFARDLVRRLEQGGKAQPLLTRDDDRFLSLRDRVDFARRHGAALFISVHADTVREDYVRGSTVYTVSEGASDALAAAAAARENRSDILAGLSLADQPDEVADILFDLTRRETKNLSVRFAKLLVAGMQDSLVVNKAPWRRAAFLVLKAPDVPSVLLELGYLSNADDGALLQSDAWRSEASEVVAAAIEEFVAEPQQAGR